MLDEFYLPTARQFCKGWGRFITPGLTNGPHRTDGWAHALGIPKSDRNSRLWHIAADEVGIPDHDGTIGERNDNPKTTFVQLADAFELFVVKLGYEVVDAQGGD